MGKNFDDNPGFQLFRSWANNYAQDCTYEKRELRLEFSVSVKHLTSNGLPKILKAAFSFLFE